MASLARLLAVLALIAAIVYGAAGRGRAAALLALLGCLVAWWMVRFWLPRAAHRAFGRGDAGRAALIYGGLRRIALDRGTRGSLDVSVAACALAAGDGDRALARLAEVEQAALGEAARAAFLNNRGYALARAGRDPQGALADCDQALGLRPDVPGFRHTRGIALLALDRVDEAIRELDAVWDALAAGEAPPGLEAERCFDLGRAWTRKGEREYARDYFERAVRAAPASPWARRAADELGRAASGAPAALAELM